MGSSTYNDSSQKQFEDELTDAGNKLLLLPSSTSELLVLLERVERLLGKVRQQPPTSTRDVLFPAMKALITDELLRHADVNIQVAVASCINELTRITAPNPPYTDDEMKESFQLFMIAFKHLSCETGPNYSRAVKILETVAKVRSFLILLDIDCDAIIIEMFQLFFTAIRSSHPSNILKYMEMIMTLVIEECDEVSFELLRPLLSSVKIDYKSVSPVSWGLGETVFRTCTTKLRQPLREAVKTMNINVDDYARIVSSLCKDACDGKNIGEKEMETANRTDPVGQTGVVSTLDRLSTPRHKDDTPLAKDDSRNEHHISNSARSDAQGVDATELPQTQMDSTVKRKRGRPKSIIKPKNEYEKKDSGAVSYDGEHEDHLALPSKRVRESLPNDSVNEVIVRPRGRPRKKENIIRQPNELKSTSGVQASPSAIKNMLANDENKTEKQSFSGQKTLDTKREECHVNDVRGEGTLVLKKLLRVKQNDEDINNESIDVDKKQILKSRSSSRPDKVKSFPLKVKKMVKSSTPNFEDNLVNKRVKVWWPRDMMFYEGIVRSYYPMTKKHLIEYDDGDQEILSMRKEKWEILSDQIPGNASLVQKQEGGQLSPGDATETPNRKEMLSTKLNAGSSSKRPKDESSTLESDNEDEHKVETE